MKVGGWLWQACLARMLMEDIAMVARKDLFSSVTRSAIVAAVAALALSTMGPSLAQAGTAPSNNGLSARHAVTDFSSQRRRHRRDHYEAALYADSAFSEAERRRAYYEAYNAYYGGGAVYDDHGPFYAEFGGYGSAVPPYLWGAPATGW